MSQCETNPILNPRRKQLLYRARHRGIREMDMVLGRFVEAHIADLSDDELDQLDTLLELPEWPLYYAVLGRGDKPFEGNIPLYDRIIAFCHQ